MKYLIMLALCCSMMACDSSTAVGNQPAQADTPSSDQQTTNPAAFIGNDYLMDDQHSYLGFKIKYFGYSPVRGRFDAFDGTLFYDPDNISALSVTVVVETHSINTGNSRRDDDLTREDSWFKADSFPHLTFSSTTVIPYADRSFDLIGNLTIKGITKTDTIHFEAPTLLSKDWAGNDQVDFSGKLILNRQDFGVFGGDFWSSIMENGLTQLSDEVEIELDIHCRKADYNIRYQETEATDIRKIVLDTIKANGLETGLSLINSSHQAGQISAGNLSTIGYTLNAWEMHEEAKLIFEEKMRLFPDQSSTHNQLGITDLLLNNQLSAKKHFESALEQNPMDSRAAEYLRLLAKF